MVHPKDKGVFFRFVLEDEIPMPTDWYRRVDGIGWVQLGDIAVTYNGVPDSRTIKDRNWFGSDIIRIIV